eukprot:CAMPEP_0171398858 /NCGR_PEP_ID=MMETSP0880-20121228/6214_1 /TAXON_ID=67004 /ORGANISM="Thalassiosira weissflogii, Strain CCMP1336" /LENGTH=37 /DNA_ID= /DNA_START= /DNA_END= /DNA_ORIENTATION=
MAESSMRDFQMWKIDMAAFGRKVGFDTCDGFGWASDK